MNLIDTKKPTVLICSLILLITNYSRAMDLIKASISGNRDLVQKLLDDPTTDPNVQNEQGDTALIWAVITGNVDVVNQLLAHEKTNPNIQDKDGLTSLMAAAAYHGHIDIVEQLLENDKTDPNVQSQDGTTALMIAANNGRELVVEKLLAHGADPNINDDDEYTPLIFAATKGYSRLAEQLLAHGADPNRKINTGLTALMLASGKGHIDIVDLLLTHYKTDPNIQAPGGNTALYIAAKEGQGAIVQKLLANSKTKPNIVNEAGNAAMIIAELHGYEAIVDLLSNSIQKSLKIPEKCSFLTFEQDDENNAITHFLISALLYKVIAIHSIHILKNIIEKIPFVTKYFSSGQWSLFLNRAGDLGVIIPEPIQDTDSLHNKYGLKNLEYIRPAAAVTVLQELPAPSKQDHYNELIGHFKEIIDYNSPQHPTRFYLTGHGAANKTIANIPLKDIGALLTVFADIDTEFIFICSCQAAGSNLLAIQSALQTIIEKQLKENMGKQIDYELFLHTQDKGIHDTETYRSPDLEQTIVEPEVPQRIKGINYAIVLQSTSDATMNTAGELNTFFTRLNSKFNETPQKQISAKGLAHILETLGQNSTALPSIRWPGATTFFRSVDLGDMAIITMNKLQALHLEKLLSLKKNVQKQFHHVSHLQNKLSDITQKESLLEMKEATEKEQQLEGCIKQAKHTLREKLHLAKPKLRKTLQIKIPIKANTKYIQIFPCDLHHCTFTILGNEIPKFISKIPGRAQHFIGKIQYTSQKANITDAFNDCANNGFICTFERGQIIFLLSLQSNVGLYDLWT